MNISSFGLLLVESLILMGLGVLFVSYYIKGGYAKKIRYIFVYVYSLKVIIGTIIVRIIIDEHGSSFLAMDTRRAAQIAENISQAGILSYNRYVPFGLDWIPYYYATIFNLTDSNSIYVMAVWSLLSSLIIIPIYILSKHLFGEKVAYLSSILVLVYPSFFVLSFVPHKDVISALFISLASLSLIKYKLSVVNISLLSIAILGLISVRPEMIVVLVLSYIFWRSFVSKSRLSSAFIIWSLIILLISSYLTYTLLPHVYLNSIFTIDGIYERVSGIENIGSGGGGIQETIIQQNVFIRTILGSIFLLIKPFPPTETLKGIDLVTFLTPSAFVIYSILPFVLYGVWGSLIRRGDETFLVILAAFTFLAAGAITGGAAVRYRIQVMPFLLMFACYGYSLPGDKKPILVVYYLSFVTGIILYIILKLLTKF